MDSMSRKERIQLKAKIVLTVGSLILLISVCTFAIVMSKI
jgi:hypothetical protein